MADWGNDLTLALDLASAADEVTMRRFGAVDLAVSTKPDLTPVSDADTAVEAAFRARVAQMRPGDAVVGEEYGETGNSPRRWIVDPIDGTKNFVRGAPVWATLVALQVDNDIVLGVVSAPALGRRWWASRGAGAWTSYDAGEPRRLQVSQVATLDDAFVSYSSLTGWEQQHRLDALLDLSRRVWRTRAFGDFWSHMLVAEGAVDASCEPEVSLWDLAALQPIVEEAGGRFSDLSGVDRADGGSVVCSNGLLHDDVVAALAAR
ncbi:MAG TPA: histidinol-phosphatase [Mycobacteriales bacterium]|jgi:histidinol-phosphatase|nr:histidinol-phosphatase [Mycobacteriales bacterium]